MKRTFRFLLFPFLASALLLLLSRSPVSAARHPSLLFDSRDVPALRKRLAGPLKPVAQALRGAVELAYEPKNDYPQQPDVNNQWYKQDIRALADTITPYAFAAVVFGDGGANQIFPELTAAQRTELAARSRTLARNYLLGVCDADFPDWLFLNFQEGTTPDLPMAHLLINVSLAYDWLYDTLTEEERERCRQRIAREAPRMYRATQDPNSWWLHEYTQNHFWINHACLGMAALAFEGEVPDTEPWRLAAAKAMARVQSVTRGVAGGAWHEGVGYGNYGMMSLIPFTIANQRLKNGPDFADTAFLRDYPAFRLYGMPASKAHRREFLVYSDFSNFQNDDTLGVIRYAAKKYRDPHAAWYAEAFTSGERQGRAGLTSWPPSQRGIILSAILYDESVVPSLPPSGKAAWDLDFYAADLSMMLSRSGWDDNASLLAVKTGVYGGHAAFTRLRQRQTPDEVLNYGHDHADDMGVYFYADGECLTTNMPGYYIGRGNNPPANKTEYANSLLVDGVGQILEGPRPGSATADPMFFDRVSTISHRGSTAHYSFSRSVGGRLYDPKLGLKTFDRAILFVDRQIPLVRDVVRGTGTHRYEIAYHAIDGAVRDGDWLKLSAKNDRLLGVKVIAPAQFEVRTVNQVAANLRAFDPDGAMTGAFIRPASDVPAVTFLTALANTRGDTWNTRPQIVPMDVTVPDRGVRITKTGSGGDQSLVVFNDSPAGIASAGGVTVKGMAGLVKQTGGKVVRAMLAAGTRLEWQKRSRIQILAGGPASLEAEYTEKNRLTLSGDVRKIRVYAPGVTTVSYNGARVPFKREGDYLIVG